MRSTERSRRGPRFTIRGMLFLTLLVALLFGWYSSVQRAGRKVSLLSRRLSYAEQELERAHDDLSRQGRPQRSRSGRVLYDENVDGRGFRGVSIVAPDSAFQLTSFKGCNFQDATLQAGGSSFQLAYFDNANLNRAKLTGAGAAFQSASFAGADLTGAVLTGGPGSFQEATFENAILINAQLICGGLTSFQVVNIDNTQFQSADLSRVDRSALESCYFKNPPSYNQQTKFPDGFDPVALGWKRVGN